MRNIWINTILMGALLVIFILIALAIEKKEARIEELEHLQTQCEQALAEKTHRLQSKIDEVALCAEMWEECYDSLITVCNPAMFPESNFAIERWQHICKQFEDYYEEK